MTSMPCTVLVDGVPLDDGATAGSADAVVLSGLRVNWGRSNSLDQPAPAVCTFTVLTPAPGTDQRGRLVLGQRIDVQTDAWVTAAGAPVNVRADPGFEAVPVGNDVGAALVGNALPVLAVAVPHKTGQRAARITPASGVGGRVAFGPGPWSSTSTAWNSFRRPVAGELWTMGLDVLPPEAKWGGLPADVRPHTFTGPADAGTVSTSTAIVVTNTDAAGWQTWAGLWAPPAGAFIGVSIAIALSRMPFSTIPLTTTWTSLAADATTTWANVNDIIVDNVLIGTPAVDGTRTAVVFSGRVTDLENRYSTGAGATLLTVTAADQLAELANRTVGATPWAVQTIADRFDAVVTASGQPIQYTIDASVSSVLVSRRDVDAQTAAGLLTELAKSVDGVLWAATSAATGPRLILEAVRSRQSGYALTMGPSSLLVVVPAGTAGVTVSACDMSLDPIRWRQDATDVATRVAGTWLDQSTAPGVTTRNVTAVDVAGEVLFGAHRVSVATQLTTAADAQVTVDSLLGRLSGLTGWRVLALTWDMDAGDDLDDAALIRALTLLDGTTRLGLPLLLVDLPTWSPIPAGTGLPLFVEGGTYTYKDAAWTLALSVSTASGSGGAGLSWTDTLPYLFTQLDPAVTWASLAGVGAIT